MDGCATAAIRLLGGHDAEAPHLDGADGQDDGAFRSWRHDGIAAANHQSVRNVPQHAQVHAMRAAKPYPVVPVTVVKDATFLASHPPDGGANDVFVKPMDLLDAMPSRDLWNPGRGQRDFHCRRYLDSAKRALGVT